MEWMDGFGLDRANSGSGPTFASRRGSSVVDHLLSNTRISAVRVHSSCAFGSDHVPITCLCPISAVADADRIPQRMRLRIEKLKDPRTRELFRTQLDEAAAELARQIDCVKANLGSHNDKQAQIDKLDNLITKKIIQIAKAVIGETHANSRRRPAILSSPRLLELYRQSVTQPSREVEQEISAELTVLRRDRFRQFAAETDSLPVNEVFAIVSQISRSQSKRKLGLGNSVACLEDYRRHFAAQTTNNLPEPNVDPPVPQFRPPLQTVNWQPST